MSPVARVRDLLLTAAALLGTVCIVVTVLAALLDVRMLIFRSGSMSPAIPTGALAFARATPANDLERGDIVSVMSADGTRVTHRVQALTTAGGMAELTLKGDANGSADRETYTVGSADRVLFNVPRVGYAIGYATSGPGLAVGAVMVVGLMWLVVRPGRSGGAKGGGRRRAGAVGVVAAIAITGSLAESPAPTQAYFSDQGTVTSAAVSTHSVVSQAQPVCVDVDGFLTLGNIARLTWPQVDARYEYTWELRQLSGTVVLGSSGQVGGGQAVGTAVTPDIGTGLIGINGNYNVAVRARLRGATSWTAATETITPVRRASILVLGVSMRCGHA